VIEISQGQKASLQLYVADANGEAVPLTGATSAKFIAKESLAAQTDYINTAGTIAAGATGKVTVAIDPEDVIDAGIFDAQVLVYNAAGDLLWATYYWLAVEPSLDADPSVASDVPSLPEVRMMLRDVCREQNLLLNDFEFKDSEILYALRWPIDQFNSWAQPKTTYTTKSFPWRFPWLRATCGYLLEMKAHGYIRDHLPYSAGGISVSDKQKWNEYMQLANRLLAEWKEFMVNQKIELNVNSAFGSLRSPYRWNAY
jgi:hypothetical protein